MRDDPVIQALREVRHRISESVRPLSPQGYVRLQRWLTERTWERRDREIEEDAASGELDFLVEEATREKDRGRLRKL